MFVQFAVNVMGVQGSFRDPDDIVQEGIARLKTFYRAMGLPATLSELGINDEKLEEMAKKVINGYKKKEFEIIPERFNKTFEDWIFNIRDWCISRQLWWGHRIPAYYHKTT